MEGKLVIKEVKDMKEAFDFVWFFLEDSYWLHKLKHVGLLPTPDGRIKAAVWFYDLKKEDEEALRKIHGSLVVVA